MARPRSNVARNIQRDREVREPTLVTNTGAFKPPAVLDAPPPRPGMRQRWVRTKILGVDDPVHVHKMFRMGWQPRKAETLPKNFSAPTLNHGQYGSVIGIEGLILCEMPHQLAEARNNYYRGKAKAAMGFVNQALTKVARDDLPIEVEHKSRSTNGSQQPEEDEED